VTATAATGRPLKPVAIAAGSWTLPQCFEWPDLKAGRSAVRPLAGEFAVPMGAPVPLDFDAPDDWAFPLFPRALGLGLHALDRLARDPGRRYGLALGLPNLFAETAYLEHALPGRDEPERMRACLGFSFDFALDYLAKRAGAAGPRLRIDSACATGNDALIAAAQWIESGAVDDCLVVAASAMLNPVGVALFHQLKALNPKRDPEASCPFDARRRGFVMGEGAAAVWLTADPPEAPLGWLCGYGQSLNAEKFVDLPDDLTTMRRACEEALAPLAGRAPAYICAHGTGTLVNDRKETQLYRELFASWGAGAPVSSIKSMIGHCLGAASLIEALACLYALADQVAPPTINLSRPDPECDLDYVPWQAAPIDGDFALSNAFAFGGQNSSVLLGRSRP